MYNKKVGKNIEKKDKRQNKPDTITILLQNMYFLLIAIGIMIIIIIGIIPLSDFNLIMKYLVICIGIVMIVTGIILMFLQFKEEEKKKEKEKESILKIMEDSRIGPLAKQLYKNYELLRRQTQQGFMISIVFITSGFVLIIIGSFGELFGFTSGGNIVTLAGMITDFISATALFIYNSNFKRLNSVSDNLLTHLRILIGFEKAEELTDNKLKSEVILKLIDALVQKIQT